MDITLDHPFCSVSKQLLKLCKPFFSSTSIKYFNYGRYFREDRKSIGSTHLLCNGNTAYEDSEIGWLFGARTTEPPPGSIIMLRGLVRLTDILFGFKLGLKVMGN